MNLLLLTEYYLNFVNAVRHSGDKAAVNSLSVNCHGLYAARNMIGVLDSDIVGSASEKS